MHPGPGPSREAKPGAKEKGNLKAKALEQNDEESRVQMDLNVGCPHRLSFMEPCQPSKVAPQLSMYVCVYVCPNWPLGK